MKVDRPLLWLLIVLVGVLDLLGYERAMNVLGGFVIGWILHGLYRLLDDLEFPWPWGPPRSWEKK